MPDANYSDEKITLRYSQALYPHTKFGVGTDYFGIMKAAIKEMHRQVGDLIFDEKRDCH